MFTLLIFSQLPSPTPPLILWRAEEWNSFAIVRQYIIIEFASISWHAPVPLLRYWLTAQEPGRMLEPASAVSKARDITEWSSFCFHHLTQQPTSHADRVCAYVPPSCYTSNLWQLWTQVLKLCSPLVIAKKKSDWMGGRRQEACGKSQQLQQ